MRSVLVWLERIVMMQASIVLLLPFICNYSYPWYCWIASSLATDLMLQQDWFHT
jgi:hypothetical protein